ncbi:MAG: hypothetical protein IKQ80_04920 [Clostridia bacterium]|nr:hypothetical protein [Clostridia bacterium]
MKKLLAIVLVLMLLTASAAFAETATVVTYANPVVNVTQDGQTQTIDLAGLEVTLSMGLAGEEPQLGEDGTLAADTRVPTILLDVSKDGAALLSGEAQFIGTALVLNLDGLSRPIAVDMTEAGEMAVGGYRQMFSALPEMAKSSLPAFTGVQIPKVDLMGLTGFLSMLGIEPETTESGASFELPAELVNMLLQMILQQVPAEALESLGLADALNQLMASGGFALRGNISDDGTTGVLTIGVHPVAEGATADEAALTVNFSSAANADTLSVDMSIGGQTMTLGELALTSLPDQAELNASLQIMQGMMSLAFSLYPQDGLQVGALEMNVTDPTGNAQKVTASLVYGQKEGADYSDFAFAVDGQMAMELINETVGDGNGNASGTATLSVDSYNEPQSNVDIASEVTQSVVDGFTFRNIENAAGAINATSMTEEENAQLQEELNGVLGKLMVAFGDVMPAA